MIFISYIPFQYIEGKIPSYNSTSKEERVVLTLTNSISKEIIYTNSSFELANLNKNETNEASSEITAPEHWPIWLQHVTCISHLMLAFNSSVNFFIYYMKRKTLNTGMNLVSTANVLLAFARIRWLVIRDIYLDILFFPWYCRPNHDRVACGWNHQNEHNDDKWSVMSKKISN